MIKIKVRNIDKGRNEPTFRPLKFAARHFYDLGIELVEDAFSYDFEFIGMADFINKKTTLQESIERGLESLQKIKGDYFIFDGSDSTSLMGAYEILKESKAIYLFKNQILKEREEYSKPKAFGKWFFGDGSGLDLSYDIPEGLWNKIKLTGWNLGYLLPEYRQHYNNTKNRLYDICAVYQTNHDLSYDHRVQNNNYYIEHRTKPSNTLSKLKHKILTGKLPQQEYYQKLTESKIALSPFGMGELCFRDFELMVYGVTMLKPDMSKINTHPNPYIENKTYYPVNLDWSNLEQVADTALLEQNSLYENFRSFFIENYTYENLAIYWHSILKDLDIIEES